MIVMVVICDVSIRPKKELRVRLKAVQVRKLKNQAARRQLALRRQRAVQRQRELRRQQEVLKRQQQQQEQGQLNQQRIFPTSAR